MRTRAVGLALQERRATAGPRSPYRLAGRLPHGQHVVAVHEDAGQTVNRPATSHTRIAGRVLEGDLGGVLVILADEQDRKFPDAGQVQPFVKGTVIDRTIAEKGDGHAIRLLELETVARPHRL